MSRVKKIALMVAMVGAIGIVSSGCYVGLDAEPAGPVVSYGGYTPLYYNGAVVYYAAAGLPYYYYGGRMVYIPRTYVGYNRYYNHWYSNRVRYRTWYTHRGRHPRYRRYNRRRYRRARTNRRVRRRTNRRVRRKRRRGRF